MSPPEVYDPGVTLGSLAPGDLDAQVIRLQAEEHPLIEDGAPRTPQEHCMRLMHLRAYEVAAVRAVGIDVLEVGCNTGYGTMRFVGVARRIVGVDVSPRAIDAARLRVRDGSPEFLTTGGGPLPFPDASFDLVVSFQVLEHVPDAPAFLGELKRVLRPEGSIILTTPNAAVRLYPGMPPWNRFHVREYLPAELAALLGATFGRVAVHGMFGAPALYDTEIRRVDGARRAVVRKAEEARIAAARAAAVAERPLVIRVARRLIPRAARARLRTALVRSAPRATVPVRPTATAPVAVSPADLQAFLQFSLDDLYYAETDLDRSMDLMAICMP